MRLGYKNALTSYDLSKYRKALSQFVSLAPSVRSQQGRFYLDYNASLCNYALSEYDKTIQLLFQVFHGVQSLRPRIAALLMVLIYKRKKGTRQDKNRLDQLFAKYQEHDQLLRYYGFVCYFRGQKNQACKVLYQVSVTDPTEANLLNYMRVKEQLRLQMFRLDNFDLRLKGRPSVLSNNMREKQLPRITAISTESRSSNFNSDRAFTKKKNICKKKNIVINKLKLSKLLQEGKVAKANIRSSRSHSGLTLDQPLPSTQNGSKQTQIMENLEPISVPCEECRADQGEQGQVNDQQQRARAIANQDLQLLQVGPSQQNQDNPPDRKFTIKSELQRELDRLDPRDPESYNRVGSCYLRLGKKQTAASFFQKSISIGPSSCSQLNLAHIYAESERPQFEQKALQILEKNQNSPDRDYCKAEIFIRQQKYEAATTLCQKHFKNDNRFKCLLIKSLKIQFKIKEAVQNAIQFCQSQLDLQTLMQIAELFFKCRQFAIAQQVIAKIFRQNINKQVVTRLALMLYSQGEHLLFDALSEADCLSLSHPQICKQCVAELKERGHIRQATTLLEQLIIKSNLDELKIMLLCMCQENEILQGRKQLFESLCDRLQKDEAKFHQANWLYDNKDFEEAKKEYLGIRELDEKNLQLLRFRLANIYYFQRNYECALAQYKRLLQSQHVQRSIVYFNLANSYSFLRRYQNAIAVYKLIEGPLETKAQYNASVCQVLLSRGGGFEISQAGEQTEIRQLLSGRMLSKCVF